MKVSSSDSGCSRGEDKGQPPPHAGDSSLFSVAVPMFVTLSHLFSISLAQRVLLPSTIKTPPLFEVCQSDTVEGAKENNTDALHGQKELNKNLPLYLLLQLTDTNLAMRKIPLAQLPLDWLYLHSYTNSNFPLNFSLFLPKGKQRNLILHGSSRPGCTVAFLTIGGE